MVYFMSRSSIKLEKPSQKVDKDEKRFTKAEHE